MGALDTRVYDGAPHEATSRSRSRSRSPDSERPSTGVPSGRWSVQRVFVMPGGGVFVQPGQATYSSWKKALAAVAAPFVTAPMLAAHSVPVGYVAIRAGATNTTKTRDASFGQYGRFGFR